MYLKTPKIPVYDTNLWADYFELVCLVNLDGIVVPSDIADRKQPNEDNIDEENGEEMRTIDKGSKEELFANEVLDIIKRRETIYQAAYPFERTIDGFAIKDKSSPQCKLYIYLLMCSTLRHFNGSQKSDLTSDFEFWGTQTLRNILSDNFIVKPFGKNSRHSSSYTGHIFQKIAQLSSDISETLVAKASDYPQTSSGDDGLDIVAFLKLPDSLGSNLVFFANCKCDDEWQNLIGSTSSETWRHRINMRNPHTNVVIIPYCNRTSSGGWQRAHKVSGYFLVDRLRLIHYLSSNATLLADLRSNEHVNWLLSQTEDLV